MSVETMQNFADFAAGTVSVLVLSCGPTTSRSVRFRCLHAFSTSSAARGTRSNRLSNSVGQCIVLLGGFWTRSYLGSVFTVQRLTHTEMIVLGLSRYVCGIQH